MSYRSPGEEARRLLQHMFGFFFLSICVGMITQGFPMLEVNGRLHFGDDVAKAMEMQRAICVLFSARAELRLL